MKNQLLSAISFCFMFVLALSNGKSHEDELRETILDGYNPESLPTDRKIQTRISFTVLNFDMDEKNQAIDLNVWVHMTWVDPRLAWRSTGKFFSIKTIACPADKVWRPDVTLYNHAEPGSAEPYIKTQVVVRNDGNMTWVPPAHIKASCVMDMTYWPHDVHNCSITFGSWVHNLNTIDLYSTKDAIMSSEDTTKFVRGEWKVTNSGINRMTKFYSCCPDEYVSLTAWMIVERIAPAYGWIVQAPAVILGIFTFIIFLLPPSSMEKILFGGLTLILDFFFLFEMSQIMHYTSDKTPLLVKYVSKQLVLTAVTLIVSVITIHITRSNYTSSFPAGCKKVLKVLSKVLYVSDTSQSGSGNSGGPSNSEKGKKDVFTGMSPSADSDWILFALITDRICLLLFAVIFFINLILYCSVL